MSAVGRRLHEVVEVMRSRDSRGLQLGWTAFFLVDGLSMVALSVWAIDHGGGAAVGVLCGGFFDLTRAGSGRIRLVVGALGITMLVLITATLCTAAIRETASAE